MKSKLHLLPIITGFAIAFGGCIKSEDVTVQEAPAFVDKANLLRLVNNYRRTGCNCGSDYMPPVADITWNDTLERAAKDHCEDMVGKNYFDHTGSDGSQPWDRVAKYNYNYSICGENIAEGYPTEQAVIEGWISSSGHCKNIMNASFKEMGIAASGKYWTQVFATRK